MKQIKFFMILVIILTLGGCNSTDTQTDNSNTENTNNNRPSSTEEPKSSVKTTHGRPSIKADGTVDLDANYFPDEVFRAYIRQYDTDGDYLLSVKERANVKKIVIEKDWKVASLLGIEYFTELTHLDCGGNQINDLDVSQNIKLEDLRCAGINLSELDVTQNTLLNHLSCGENGISKLDVSKNTLLEYLSCRKNYLTELDVTRNTELKELRCFGNQLKVLDVRGIPLKNLECDDDINIFGWEKKKSSN